MVWIIISTEKIGGAEKRFVGIWETLMSNTNLKEEVTLVLSKSLNDIFSKSIEYKASLAKYKQYVFIEDVLSKDGIKSYGSKVQTFVKSHTQIGDTLHFIDGHTLKKYKDRKVIFSVTQSSLKNLTVKGKLAQLYGAYLSNKVDVLDPKIYKLFSKIFFYKKNNILNTPGSFCNTELFYPKNWEEKKNWIVFLGRFEPVKQIINYIKAIPSINESFKKNNLSYTFFLIGSGSLELEIKTILSKKEYEDIHIIVEYREDVNEILNQAKFFVSLQLHNNYPSRSLIEAMSAGSIPIVTDVGETGYLVKNEFGYFVPENFTANDLKLAFENATLLASKEQKNKSIKARNHIIENFSAKKSSDYFVNLYNFSQ